MKDVQPINRPLWVFRFSMLVVVGALAFGAACVDLIPPGGGGGGGGGDDPPEFTNADRARGGALYDKWWKVAGLDAPEDNHSFWATRPDLESNARTGADTWRCKECHGWDYKGFDGAYASGSHRTGVAGIFGSTMSAQEIFDNIKDTHGYGAAGLTDGDIWDLAKFVAEGLIDTDDIVDGSAFNGSTHAGGPLYTSTCAGCHGPDGLSIPPNADPDHDEWVGKLANENPWEFQHKVRFGQPGTIMPAQVGLLSTEEVGDLGAYSQTLPEG